MGVLSSSAIGYSFPQSLETLFGHLIWKSSAQSVRIWRMPPCHRDCNETNWRLFTFRMGDCLACQICIDFIVPIYMFCQCHVGQHLFDNIYLRKGNGNAGTSLVLILGHPLIFRTMATHVTAEPRIKAEAFHKDSVFIIQNNECMAPSMEYMHPFLSDY